MLITSLYLYRVQQFYEAYASVTQFMSDFERELLIDSSYLH